MGKNEGRNAKKTYAQTYTSNILTRDVLVDEDKRVK